MNLEQKRQHWIEHTILKVGEGDKETIEYLEDLVLFGCYGPEVFSQFGLGLQGFVFRQSRTNVLMTVKVVEGNVPLVAFVSSATTRGCVEQMFDLLFASRLKWQKDKYPWI